MNKRTQTPTMRRLLKEANCCELCGSRRSLEVHHIIPVACGGPEDDENNMIVVCISCHSRLTPRKILGRIGIDKALLHDSILRIYEQFYEKMGDCLNDSFLLDVEDLCDLFDRVIDSEMIRNEKRRNKLDEYLHSEFHKGISHMNKHIKGGET